MRQLSLLFILYFVSSCSLKEALVDNKLQTKSKITPIAEARSLAETYGDGKTARFTVQVPLTEDSIGYYDVDDVLGNGQISVEEKNFFERFVDSLKLHLYKLGVSLGYSNKIKFTTTFDFSFIDPEFIKSAKVKKVFFTTDDCRPEDLTCDSNGTHTNSFNIVDTFFVNIAPTKGEEHELMENMEDETFDEIEEASFATEQSIQAFNGEEILVLNDDDNINDININLVNFKNRVPYMNLVSEGLDDTEKYLRFELKSNKSKIKEYLRSSKFKSMITSINSSHKILDIKLKKNVAPSDLIKAIRDDQNPVLKRMFIFRMNSNTIGIKKLFKSETFKPLVRNVSLIGRSLYVELLDDASIPLFQQMIEGDKSQIKEFDIFRVDRCIHNNCIDFNARNINLVPLISKSPKVDIDSYLSIDALNSRDFKYNGFIEVEIEIKSPF